MKKFLVLVIFVIFVPNIVFAQDGYLNFKWGMSSNEVQNSLEGESREGYRKNLPFPDILGYMMHYFYGTELRNSFNNRVRIPTNSTLRIINGETRYVYIYETYTNAAYNNYYNEGFCFYFEENKLFGVMTVFNGDNIFRDLQSRYGAGNRVENMNEDVRVWVNNNRFIIWVKDTNFRSFVGFYDSASVRRICQSSMEGNRLSLREEQQRTRSRLD